MRGECFAWVVTHSPSPLSKWTWGSKSHTMLQAIYSLFFGAGAVGEACQTHVRTTLEELFQSNNQQPEYAGGDEHDRGKHGEKRNRSGRRLSARIGPRR
jgi:hypothetical protein